MQRWSIHWQGVVALLLLLFFTALAVAAPLLAPRDPSGRVSSFRMVKVAISRYPNPPNADFWLGTVPVGMRSQQADVYFSLIWGARSALIFGVIATLLMSLFGTLVGAVSSYLGGTAGQVILRITDAFLAFPVIAGIVLFGQLIFPSTVGAKPGLIQSSLAQLGVDNVMVVLVCFGWMPYTRIVYADMERIRRADFVTAAQLVGASPGRILLRHLIPNSISSVIVLATRDVGGVVLLQATFTYIGVGGGSAWGELLSTGRNWILGHGGNPLQYWWVFLPVTAALVIFGIGWNLLGDYINELLNPRLQNYIPD